MLDIFTPILLHGKVPFIYFLGKLLKKLINLIHKKVTFTHLSNLFSCFTKQDYICNDISRKPSSRHNSENPRSETYCSHNQEPRSGHKCYGDNPGWSFPEVGLLDSRKFSILTRIEKNITQLCHNAVRRESWFVEVYLVRTFSKYRFSDFFFLLCAFHEKKFQLSQKAYLMSRFPFSCI